MNKTGWKRRIKKACEGAKTYQPFFDSVIDTLAGIMEMRDNAQERFEASGGNTIIKHTNRAGQTNIVKNPALTVLMDCNAQALAYWHQLGLTPKAYKSMTGSLKAQRESRSLEDILAEMES